MAALLGVLLMGSFLAQSAAAQEGRYSPWRNPVQPVPAGKGAQELVDELRAMIEKAEKSRAADPRFLRDLRDLAGRFDVPWRKKLFSDDFSDGDFTAGPAWTVTAGRFWVEKGYGLRSAVTPQAPAQQKKVSNEDLAVALLGSLLNRAAGGGQQTVSAPDQAAEIRLPRKITNAFSLRFELSSWEARGRLELGLTQGRGKAGYRLAYNPGATPSLELLRVTDRGTSVVEASRVPVTLEDKKTHVIDWTRSADGSMAVAVDGEERLRVRDGGFRGPFDGFVMVNRGGDFILRRVSALGTQ